MVAMASSLMSIAIHSSDRLLKSVLSCRLSWRSSFIILLAGNEVRCERQALGGPISVFLPIMFMVGSWGHAE